MANIAFMVATRGAPRRAAAVLECAKALASGLHTIQYLCGVDEDDEPFPNFAPDDVQLIVAPRQLTPAAVWNNCVKYAVDADLYSVGTDKCFWATPSWDHIMASVGAQTHAPVFSANHLNQPGMCVHPIVTAQWLKATDGKLFVELFPYWFADTWLDEIASYVTGEHTLVIPQLPVAGHNGLTRGMYDLDWWWDIFTKTRGARIVEALRIRKVLGLPPLEMHIIGSRMAEWKARDAHFKPLLADMQKAAADPTAINPRYEETKQIAEQYAKDNFIEWSQITGGKTHGGPDPER